MKIMNRTAAAALALLLILAIALPAAAQATLVETAEMYYARPFVGDKASSVTPISADENKYLVSVSQIYCVKRDADGNPVKDGKGNTVFYTLTADDTFQPGVLYWIRFEFVPRSGYQITDSQTKYIINSIERKPSAGTHLCEETFQPRPESERKTEASSKDQECPYCHGTHNGFLGFLTAFFHKILFRLFGEKK